MIRAVRRQKNVTRMDVLDPKEGAAAVRLDED